MPTFVKAILSTTTICLATSFLISCSSGQNFSEFPGFTEHFKKYPPLNSAPNENQNELLNLYKPKIFLDENQSQPVDFYEDYIAKGELLVNGKVISENPDAELLNKHRDDPGAIFEFRGDYREAGTSIVYARIDNEKIEYKGTEYQFTFLSYNLVFPVSGILLGLDFLPSLALTIGGNLNDWHQLDHYVGLSVALLNNKAVAVTLQQHNHHTSYLLDTDIQTDSNERGFSVDIALRSNELYPHNSEQTEHPGVSFLSEKNIEFVMTGKDKPYMAGHDITHGVKALEYTLTFLPQTDAFYQFKGSLGKSRLLPGRSGPPGADYATLPGLMPRTVRLVTGYRPGPVDKEIQLFTELFDKENFSIRPHAIDAYQDRFFAAL